MQRFKILLGASVLICSVFTLLSLNDSSAIASQNPEMGISVVEQEEIVRNQEEIRLYRMRQNELKIYLKAYFKKAIAAGDIVGAGVSIVKGDSIVISSGFGRKNTNQTNKVDGETIFRLGSLSKGFAGILAADLKSEGKLDWDDKVTDYLPGFQLGDAANTAKIKISNILSHTSGTPYHSFTNLVEAGLSMSAIANRFNEVIPISEPGAMYSYQNAMFALSGEIMRKATGKDITTSLNERFFKPLGMHTAIMDFETLDKEENVAFPHTRGRKGWKRAQLTDSYYNAVAAGGIDASALDMAKWMRFLLGHNPEVMNRTDIQEAFNPFIALNAHNKYYQRWPGHLQSAYGFGWRIHKFESEDPTAETTIWHHGGSVNNYRNEIAVYPEGDLGICVLLNANSRLAKTVIPDLYEIVKEIYDQVPSKIVVEKSTPTLSDTFYQ